MFCVKPCHFSAFALWRRTPWLPYCYWSHYDSTILSERWASNSDLILFVDGSCLQSPNGNLVAGYAVCSSSEAIEAFSLPVLSVQVAELRGWTWASLLAHGKAATIYTDSWYAFGVVHGFGQLWKQRGFLTSMGTPIKQMAAMCPLCCPLYFCLPLCLLLNVKLIYAVVMMSLEEML